MIGGRACGSGYAEAQSVYTELQKNVRHRARSNFWKHNAKYSTTLRFTKDSFADARSVLPMTRVAHSDGQSWQRWGGISPKITLKDVS